MKWILFLTFTTNSFAQDDFENLLKQQQKEIALMENKADDYLSAITNEFDNYQIEQERLFKKFKDDVDKKWNEFKSSSAKTYVDYDSDLNARGSIDFENGVVEIEVIVDEDSKRQKGEDRLRNKLEQMVRKNAGDKKTLLKNQIKNSKGRTVTSENAESYAQDIVKNNTVKKEKITSKDGKKRIKYTVSVKMQPDHVKIRAERFKQNVLKQSKRFNIDPAVAFAIMQTESSFNPQAQSHIPAFGLMQLVPKSGARDAYHYVYKKDKLLTGKYLFVPKNNIELGCAYISKVRHTYFKNVEDEKSAYYCTISAYNTGAGNVAKAFTGETKLGSATREVNSMGSDGVYKTLKNNLPYEETRKYLEKVTARIEYYRTWR